MESGLVYYYCCWHFYLIFVVPLYVIKNHSIGVATAELPAVGLTGTLGTKGGGFLPFQALRSTDFVWGHTCPQFLWFSLEGQKYPPTFPFRSNRPPGAA